MTKKFTARRREPKPRLFVYAQNIVSVQIERFAQVRKRIERRQPIAFYVMCDHRLIYIQQSRNFRLRLAAPFDCFRKFFMDIRSSNDFTHSIIICCLAIIYLTYAV